MVSKFILSLKYLDCIYFCDYILCDYIYLSQNQFHFARNEDLGTGL